MKPSLCINRKCFGPANDANVHIWCRVTLSHMTSCVHVHVLMHAAISVRFHLTKWLFLVSGYWYVVVPSDPGLSTSMTSINEARRGFMNVVNGSVLPQDDMVSLLLHRLYNYNIHFCTLNQAVLYMYRISSKHSALLIIRHPLLND